MKKIVLLFLLSPALGFSQAVIDSVTYSTDTVFTENGFTVKYYKAEATDTVRIKQRIRRLQTGIQNINNDLVVMVERRNKLQALRDRLIARIQEIRNQ